MPQRALIMSSLLISQCGCVGQSSNKKQILIVGYPLFVLDMSDSWYSGQFVICVRDARIMQVIKLHSITISTDYWYY